MAFLSRTAAKIRTGATRAWTYAKSHKLLSAIVLIIVLGGGYMVYAKEAKDATTTQYVLAAAANEPIQTTVTASGDVSANHQLDLSPKASGEVTGVYVKAGDTVKAGQTLVTIDDTDAEKTLRDAQLSLESAQISYTQAITSAQDSTQNNQTSLSTASGNGFDAAASAETDIATILPGIHDILLGNSDVPGYVGLPFSNAYVDVIEGEAPTAQTLRDQAITSYNAAETSYENTVQLYQAASRTSSTSDIQSLLASMQDTATKTNQAVKDTNAFLNLVNDTVTQHDLLTVPPSLSSQMTTLSSYTSKANSDASSITSAISSITNAQQDVSSDQQSISGGTPLAIQSAELSLAKAKESVADAQEDLSDYVVTAPFDGTVAQVDVQKFDQSSSKVLTLITTQQYADISLNETDISKVRAGQKATLTFDAIDGLTIDGTVAEVDQIGTVSQGVSTYTVKIGFDTQDPRVLPGMTVNATIITASKDSALVVPSSAVKSTTLNGQTEYYVEVATASSTGALGGSGRTASSTRAFSGSGRMAGSSTASSSARYAGFAGRFGSTTASTTRAVGAGFTGTTRTQTVSTDSVTIKRVPVTIGLQSDTMTEITSGLSAGQLVVSQSLNASGTATKTTSSGLFGLFGGSKTTGTAARATTGTTGTARTGAGAAAGFGGGAAAGGFGGGAGFSGRGG